MDIYERVTYPGEVAAVYGEIELAGEALELEQARLARVQEGADLEKMERGLAVKKADLALQEAIRKKDRLEKGTQQVQLKRLGADVQDTRAAMLLADREFRLEKEREERLHAMIEKGKVYAPADGVVVHARLGPEQGGTKVGEGTTIREGQQIFHITMEPERSESEVK